MIVYRAPTRIVDPNQVWSHAASDPLRFLIEFGEIESALVDQWCPEIDDTSIEIERLRQISMIAARNYLAEAPVRVPSLELPQGPLTVSVPEGYAYYGLDPRSYVAASSDFYRSAQPAEVICIGIRSIGSSLSALVAAALEQLGAEVSAFTVRPHGHPFDRRLAIGPGLERIWSAAHQAHFLIVDEGPGLSGSSFAAVAGAVSGLGIPGRQIVFFPSWTPDGSDFVSESARSTWQSHEKFCREFQPPPDWVDLSAGKWRSIFYGHESEYPEIQPRHEARKYLIRSDRGACLIKFEGLGSYGEARYERARLLAAQGFCPAVLDFSNGFMQTEFIPGQPLSASCRDPELFETMARYLAFRASEFRVETGTPMRELIRMIEVNCGQDASEGFGVATTPVITDGRMLPHEWIATERGYLKTDAVDHGDNHFYPGPTDIAWDLAGAMAEFQLNQDEADRLTELYIHNSADTDVIHRLPFFRTAYSAFRIGYQKMFARQEVPTSV